MAIMLALYSFLVVPINSFSPHQTEGEITVDWRCKIDSKLHRSQERIFAKQRIRQSLHRLQSVSDQRWTLADASNDPTQIPEWATGDADFLREFRTQPGKKCRTRKAGAIKESDETISPGKPTWTLENRSRLWIEVTASIFSTNDHDDDDDDAYERPCDYNVSPRVAFLAPKGGTTNLCDPRERYQDFCTFRIEYPESRIEEPQRSHYLLVQTEDEGKWVVPIE